MVQASYSLLNAKLPPNTVLSDVRLNKQVNINHTAYLERLKQAYTLFHEQKRFWLEVTLWERLYYKNNNQHRPFHRFQRVQEVRRILKRIKSISLDKEIERLYISFWNAKTLDKCTGKWNYIPSKESIQYTMHRLIGISLLFDKLKIALIETYRSNSTLLKLEHFISLALVYMSLCSRLYVLCNQWISDIEACYQMLSEWQASFPSAVKQKDRVQFDMEFNLECDATTLDTVRASFAEKTMTLKSSDQHKVHLESFLASRSVMDKVKEIVEEVGDVDMLDFEDLGGEFLVLQGVF